jgi:hypothetical protein
MVKVYNIKSDYAEKPIAQIRTDGHAISWIFDNSEGMLPQAVGKEFAKLQAMVASSSHLTLEEPLESTTSLLTYVLSNGDTVQMSTDAKTAILNGKLLSPEEQQSLFAAIRSGQLQISHKADISKPVPLQPMHEGLPEPKPIISQESRAAMNAYAKHLREKKAMSDKDYDHEIEEQDYKGMSTQDAAFAKGLLYHLKYGDKNGR